MYRYLMYTYIHYHNLTISIFHIGKTKPQNLIPPNANISHTINKIPYFQNARIPFYTPAHRAVWWEAWRSSSMICMHFSKSAHKFIMTSFSPAIPQNSNNKKPYKRR